MPHNIALQKNGNLLSPAPTIFFSFFFSYHEPISFFSPLIIVQIRMFGQQNINYVCLFDFTSCIFFFSFFCFFLPELCWRMGWRNAIMQCKKQQHQQWGTPGWLIRVVGLMAIMVQVIRSHKKIAWKKRKKLGFWGWAAGKTSIERPCYCICCDALRFSFSNGWWNGEVLYRIFMNADKILLLVHFIHMNETGWCSSTCRRVSV